MDYTREPIVETVITPKDGHRLTVRNSKTPGLEEFVVDALEIVSFGNNCFFRNLERPRAFMVPASDYEVLEIREAKLPLKAATPDVPVRATPPRPQNREPEKRKPLPKEPELPVVTEQASLPEPSPEEALPPAPLEPRSDRRSDRRKNQRRRRGGGGREETSHEEVKPLPEKEKKSEEPSAPTPVVENKEPRQQMNVLLPPPPTLIRDDLERMRQSEQYKGAFYLKEPKEEAKAPVEADDIPIVPFALQGEDEPRVEEVRPNVENIYKATPAPLDEDGAR